VLEPADLQFWEIFADWAAQDRNLSASLGLLLLAPRQIQLIDVGTEGSSAEVSIHLSDIFHLHLLQQNLVYLGKSFAFSF